MIVLKKIPPSLRILWPFYLGFTLLVVLVSEHAFFWDTVQLSSKQAHFFFEQKFLTFLLPDKIDSGHFPFMGIYLASAWLVFGKSLIVSHLIMIPFVWLIVYQAYRLIRRLFDKPWVLWALTIVLLDATLLAQVSLVSPDVILLAAFLWALNAIWSRQNPRLILATCLLVMISMRGMMLVFAVFLFDNVLHQKRLQPPQCLIDIFKRTLPYLPAGFMAISFLSYHYYAKGWIGYHPDSPWAESFGAVGITGFFRNGAIAAWRLIDFGRLALWLVFLLSILKIRKLWQQKHFRILLALFVILSICLIPSMLLHQSLTAHRYFLPMILVFAVLACYSFFSILQSASKKRLLSVFLILALLAGNLIVYPDHIAQGWDASLAHLPYYKLRKDMLLYMKENDIAIEQTGSDFPNLSPLKYIDLKDDTRNFKRYNLSEDKYIFYSNVYNNFSNQELKKLQNDWLVVKTFQQCGIRLSLYKAPDKQ